MVTVPRIAVVSCLSTTPFIYGIRHEGKLRAELLLSDPDTVTQDFLEHRADIALIPFTAMPLLADARTVTEYCVGGVAAERETLLASDDPLVGIWKELCGELPFAFAVWVAHADTDPDTIEALQYALTYGLERGYEAMTEAAPELDPLRAYEVLSGFDYIFDNEKNQALQQFWDSGIKVAPRANPG